MVSYNWMDGERVANKVLIEIKIIMLSIKYSPKENNIYSKQLNTQINTNPRDTQHILLCVKTINKLLVIYSKLVVRQESCCRTGLQTAQSVLLSNQPSEQAAQGDQHATRD